MPSTKAVTSPLNPSLHFFPSSCTRFQDRAKGKKIKICEYDKLLQNCIDTHGSRAYQLEKGIIARTNNLTNSSAKIDRCNRFKTYECDAVVSAGITQCISSDTGISEDSFHILIFLSAARVIVVEIDAYFPSEIAVRFVASALNAFVADGEALFLFGTRVQTTFRYYVSGWTFSCGVGSGVGSGRRSVGSGLCGTWSRFTAAGNVERSWCWCSRTTWSFEYPGTRVFAVETRIQFLLLSAETRCLFIFNAITDNLSLDRSLSSSFTFLPILLQ